MTRLLARDALTNHLLSVDAEARPSSCDTRQRRDTVYAVFEKTAQDHRAKDLLGLVDGRRAAIYPHRIFADLLLLPQPAPVPPDTALEAVQRRLLEESAYALAVVDDAGRLIGAVTRETVLAALVQDERRNARGLRESLELHERQRALIAYEIHDGIVQYATASMMHLERCAGLQQGMNEEAETEFLRAMALLRETIAEARTLCQGLQPSLEGGIIQAVNDLIAARRTPSGAAVELVSTGGEPHVPEAYRLTIFRMAQEALSNALKHSGSEQVRVELSNLTDRVELVVRDWGRGFDSEIAPAGHGLSGIRRRAGLLKGEVELRTGPGQGTVIRVTIPVPSDAACAACG